MWDDYIGGLKPAKIIALMYTHGPDIVLCDRDELKFRCDNASAKGGCCDQDSWLYFACKRVQHATNYGVKARTGCEQIMSDSYKVAGAPVYISEKDFETLQRFYFVRYSGLYQWHNACKQHVFDGHNLTSASGHTRVFHGRRRSWNAKSRAIETDHTTWKEYLADEPQENTTYATNLALFKLWNDHENRVQQNPRTNIPENPGRPQSNGVLERSLALDRREGSSYLRIEPLHQVHDALIGQFRIEDTDWAIARIRSYFDNPLTIANTKLVIPFEGSYGPSWGEMGTKYGGGNI